MSDPLIDALQSLPTRKSTFVDWLSRQPTTRREALEAAIYDPDGPAIRKLGELLRDHGASVSDETIAVMRRRGRSVA